MIKKYFTALLCLCMLCFAVVGCSAAKQGPLLNGEDPEATEPVLDPVPTPSPTPSSSVRGDYATNRAPLPFGELGTFDGIAWQVANAPYVFDLTVTNIWRGQEAKNVLSEGSMTLPELAEDEELFLARVRVNLTQCKDSEALVDFSSLSFAFVQTNGNTVFRCPVMVKANDATLNQFGEGGYLETTLVGKAKKADAVTLVFQPDWDNGFWMATE